MRVSCEEKQGRIRVRMRFCFALVIGLAFLEPSTAAAQTVRFRTTLGDIDVNLLPNSAPQTVANFLDYVNRGAYDNSIFHRSVKGFIIQGGGYRFQNQSVDEIPANPPVRNEFSISNTRGTLAMAKLGNNPNSATNQWFFNLGDNSGNLNNQNGGFTVFGRVANTASLTIMDRIAALPVYSGSPISSELPLASYTGGPVQESNYVIVRSIAPLGTAPAISSGGVIAAGSFGGASTAAPGSFIEIYGSNLAGSTRQWGDSDFSNGSAPTTLDGVTVTVGGQPAYVYYVSPTQVNVQVPANVTTGGNVPVVVSYGGQSSGSVPLAIQPLAGALLAPATYKVNDKQYVLAVHADNNAFVSNGNIPDIAAAPAVPAETLILYGIGFGPVTGGTRVAGQIASGATAIASTVQILFDQAQAEVLYAGFVPGLVGVYQFNVVVPRSVSSGDVPLTVKLAGEALPQTLYIPVR